MVKNEETVQNLDDIRSVLTTLTSENEVDAAVAEDKALEEAEQKYLNKRAGVLHVTQFVYNPEDYIYERDEDGNLLDGYPKLKDTAKPLLTLVRVQQFVQKFNETKEIAWILHDKDTYTESDEKSDPTGRKREGEPKPPHFHIIIRSKMKKLPSGVEARQPIRLRTIARALGIPMECIEITKGKIAFPSGLAYLVHRTVQAQALHKYQYDRSEVHANFDWWKLANQYIIKREKAVGKDIKFGKWSEQLNPEAKDFELTLWACAVLYDGISINTIKERVPLLYEKHAKRFDRNRQKYLAQEAKLPSQRLNFLICGKPGTGKTEMAMGLARTFYADLSDDECFFEVGDRGVRFQRYDGQPVIIWSDVLGSSLATEFDIQSFINLIDTTPHGNMTNVKYGDVKLINKVNIFCTTEDYVTFMTGLNLGRVSSLKQVYRRIPFIIPLSYDDFDIGINREFIGESKDFREYEWHRDVAGSAQEMRRVLQDNEPAYRFVQGRMLSPVRELADMTIGKRITNTEGFFGAKPNTEDMPPMPDSLDEETLAKFMTYGTQIDFYDKYGKQLEEFELREFEDLIAFKKKQLENIEMAAMDIGVRLAKGEVVSIPRTYDEWNNHGANLRWKAQTSHTIDFDNEPF